MLHIFCRRLALHFVLRVEANTMLRQRVCSPGLPALGAWAAVRRRSRGGGGVSTLARARMAGTQQRQLAASLENLVGQITHRLRLVLLSLLLQSLSCSLLLLGLLHQPPLLRQLRLKPVKVLVADGAALHQAFACGRRRGPACTRLSVRLLMQAPLCLLGARICLLQLFAVEGAQLLHLSLQLAHARPRANGPVAAGVCILELGLEGDPNALVLLSQRAHRLLRLLLPHLQGLLQVSHLGVQSLHGGGLLHGRLGGLNQSS
mmetsp:Transcript_47037/g.87683  ORF Transcript_47037/g.87683 Transcript_47037/m.87683 type:complete len:261 (-) Transcript_47037:90-872(-)